MSDKINYNELSKTNEKTELKKTVNENAPKKPKPQKPKVKDKQVKIVNCSKLNVRSEPDKDAKIVYIINNGDVMFVDAKDNKKGWLSVYNEAGIAGYIISKFAKEI